MFFYLTLPKSHEEVYVANFSGPFLALKKLFSCRIILLHMGFLWAPTSIYPKSTCFPLLSGTNHLRFTIFSFCKKKAVPEVPEFTNTYKNKQAIIKTKQNRKAKYKTPPPLQLKKIFIIVLRLVLYLYDVYHLTESTISPGPR